MVLNGWEMGVSESIGVVLLIGLSVDYVVHLASHFSSASTVKIE
jgi:predicted RND superfamily exporter protein